MNIPVDFAPFMLGLVIGVILSAALAVRPVALWTAGLATIAILFLFAQGGQDELIDTGARIAGHLKQASDSGLVGGVLGGKMAAAVLRGIKTRP